MTWIKTFSYSEAPPSLKKLYERVKGPDDKVDNILKAHSLRPHTLTGHMALYKNVLHNSQNELPKWFLEAIGVYVSMLNRCHYCVDHHYQGMKRLLKDPEKAAAIQAAFLVDKPNQVFNGKYLAALNYARDLTLHPGDMASVYIEKMRDAGLSDGEILEVNQVVAYFNYANRTVLGLGVITEGDVLGLSPNDSDDPDNWGHS